MREPHSPSNESSYNCIGNEQKAWWLCFDKLNYLLLPANSNIWKSRFFKKVTIFNLKKEWIFNKKSLNVKKKRISRHRVYSHLSSFGKKHNQNKFSIIDQITEINANLFKARKKKKRTNITLGTFQIKDTNICWILNIPLYIEIALNSSSHQHAIAIPGLWWFTFGWKLNQKAQLRLCLYKYQ